MIQVYKPNNTNYDKNGDMSLFPIIAEVNATINDLWDACLKHPIDAEGRWKFLETDSVVKMPSFNGEQLFRIRKIHKSDSAITCDMEPIFFDSIDDCFLQDVRPTEKDGQSALNMMLASNSKYSGISDIKTVATAYYRDVNFMEASNGDIDQSFLKRWGGEICYDNFTVVINERVGVDNGVELRYGKNIKKNGLMEVIDTREVVTRIKPKAYNGHTMSGIRFVDSPNIDKYPTIRIRTMKFDDVKMAEDAVEGDADNGIIICNNQAELNEVLLRKCQEQYDAGIDKPKVTISADMVLLQNTELYKGLEELERVSLGDTVHCKHESLNIVTDARVVSLKYDCIRKKVTYVNIGDYKGDYFDKMDSMTGRINSSVENLIFQIENPNSSFRQSMQALVDEMAASIAGYDGGNMLITNNSDGKPNGIMIMDTDSKDTAKKVLWFNLNGITYSSNGVNGPFNNVWSFERGGFVADWIIAGTMLANRISGGVLTLGGTDDGNGICEVKDADGNVVARLDKNGLTTNSAKITGGSLRIETNSKDYNAIDLKSEVNGLKTRTYITPSSMCVYYQYSNGEKYCVIINSVVAAGTFDGDIFSDDPPPATYNKWIGSTGIYDGDAFTGSFYDKDGRKVSVYGGVIQNIE